MSQAYVTCTKYTYGYEAEQADVCTSSSCTMWYIAMRRSRGIRRSCLDAGDRSLCPASGSPAGDSRMCLPARRDCGGGRTQSLLTRTQLSRAFRPFSSCTRPLNSEGELMYSRIIRILNQYQYQSSIICESAPHHTTLGQN